MTEVESAILRRTMAIGDLRSVVELGCGEGRLSLVLQEAAKRYCAFDATARFLRRVPLRSEARSSRVAGNVYRLPFRDRAFTFATLIRVHGFLGDPVGAFREIRRILVPGGLLVVSYEPHPSLGSLADDLKVALADRAGEPVRPRTFSRAPLVTVRPSALPTWSSSRRHFAEELASAGFSTVREYPTGLEDYRVMRWLPSAMFVRLSEVLPRAGGFPSRVVVARRAD